MICRARRKMKRGDDARIAPALRRRKNMSNEMENVESRIKWRSADPAEARVVENELLTKRSETHVVRSMTSHTDKKSVLAEGVSAMDEVAFAVTPRKVEDISSAARAGRACAGRRGPDENSKECRWRGKSDQRP